MHGKYNSLEQSKLIDLKKYVSDPFSRFVCSILEKPLEKILSIDAINRIYSKTHFDQTKANPFETILKVLNVFIKVNAFDLRRIPEKGSLLVTANHPFGGIEGIILGHLLLQIRPDVRILANYLLQQIPELYDYIIPVDPFSNKNATIDNSLSFRRAIRWIENGGTLISFPSGAVSHFHLTQGKITDPAWNRHIGAFAKHTKCTTLPVYFAGHNGLPFQIIGLFHPLLRTMMLPRELINKQSKTIMFSIGKPVPWEKLESHGSEERIIGYLRQKTYLLANRDDDNKRTNVQTARRGKENPVVPPLPAELLEEDIRKLGPDQLLVESGDYVVYLSDASGIPNILREIGRLREITFRLVGEGTGKALDLDKFDAHYLHLFIWHKINREVVGAYRLTPVDKTIDQFGVGSLYSSTLFRIRKGLLDVLENAVELGRSWIREEYQRQYQCLALLWQGIGQYIIREPQYYILFGPVSISKTYHYISRYLLIRFLKKHRYDRSLTRQVAPYHPYRYPKIKNPETINFLESVDDLETVSLIISEFERDGKGIPVLLRQYLKLNAKILSFNVDPDFSDVIDGLILTDLRNTDQRILRRFMGNDGFEIFSRSWPLHISFPYAYSISQKN